MNKCDFGSFKRQTGWVSWFRLYHHGENRILRNGKTDIIFATREEAEAAAKDVFLHHMNSPITGMMIENHRQGAKDKAEAVFRKEKVTA